MIKKLWLLYNMIFLKLYPTMIMFQDNCTNWQQQSYFLLLIMKIVSAYTDSSSLVLHVVHRSVEEHYNTPASDQLIIEAVLVINGTIGRLP